MEIVLIVMAKVKIMELLQQKLKLRYCDCCRIDLIILMH